MSKIFNRLLILIAVLVSIPLLPFEIVFYSIRWVITGKEFPDNPICISLTL